MHTGLNFSFSDIGYNFIVGGDGNIYEGDEYEVVRRILGLYDFNFRR